MVGFCLSDRRRGVVAGTGECRGMGWQRLYFHASCLVCGRPSSRVFAAFSSSWPQCSLRSADFLLATFMSPLGTEGSFYSHDMGSSAAITHFSAPDWFLGTLVLPPLWLPPWSKVHFLCSHFPKPLIWRFFCSYHNHQPYRTWPNNGGSSEIYQYPCFSSLWLSLRLVCSEAWFIKILPGFVLEQ